MRRNSALKKITQLTPAKYNPREISDKALAGLTTSLQKFGDIAGIVFNTRTGHLVTGHQRVKSLTEAYGDLPIKNAAIETPDGEVFRVRLVDWDLKKEKAALVAANAATIQGEFTSELGPLLKGIKLDMPDVFDALDLSTLWDLIQLEGDDELTEEHPVPDPPKRPIVKRGDIFQLGKHRIMCGDATKEDDVKAVLAGAKPILMVTDPPYGVDYHPEWRAKAAEDGVINYGARAMGKVNNDDRSDWTEAYALFTGDVVYVWHASTYGSIVAANLASLKFNLVSQIIWCKPSLVISRGDYHWQHEPCWYAVRKGKKHNWQGARDQSTVWQIANGTFQGKGSLGEEDKPTGHSTQKPLECMGRPIRNNTKPGQAIYDPFLGAGTTVIAAQKLDRISYGLEISPAYIEVIIRRFAENCTDGKKPPRFKHINGSLTLDRILRNGSKATKRHP